MGFRGPGFRGLEFRGLGVGGFRISFGGAPDVFASLRLQKLWCGTVYLQALLLTCC